MSIYRVSSPSSPLDQITRGLFTGFRLFFKLMVVLTCIMVAGVLLYKAGKGRSGETEEAVTTHRDIRRNIALGISGPATGQLSVEQVANVVRWKPLVPVAAGIGDPSGFESRVEIREDAGVIAYQVIIGPYDTEVSRDLKQSSGWVSLKLFQENGLPVPGFENGSKIQLSSFQFHQEGGLPLGWIHQGTLSQGNPAGDSRISRFELGWVIPSSASVSRPVHIGLR